jgi:hypothetical protein
MIVITAQEALNYKNIRENNISQQFEFNKEIWVKLFKERINRKISIHYSSGNNDKLVFTISDLGFIQTDPKFSELLISVLETVKNDYENAGWKITAEILVDKFMKKVQFELDIQ